MFSKFRTGAKRATGRQGRQPGPDEELDSPSTQRRRERVTGLHGNHSVDALRDHGTSTTVVASTAPTLPPIPRIASKASHHGASDLGSPVLPTIRPVDNERALAEESSPISDESLSPGDQEPLRLVRSLDRAKVGLQADKTFMDAMLMPPPPRPTLHTNAPPGHTFQRSLTDFNARPSTARTASSRASSTANEIPSPYRIPEPEEWVTPPQAIQLGSQVPARPKSRLTKLNPFSYLHRKKSSQSPTDEIDNSAIAKRASFISPVQPLSDEYDPRIKGTGVHDFSAPRPSHFVSVQNLRSAAAIDAIELPADSLYDHRRGSDSNLPQRHLGDPSPERKHVTVFKEDFGHSAEEWRLNPDDRRNQSSSDIVDRVAALEKAAKDEKRKSSLPAFAVHMPEDIPSPGEAFHTPKSSKMVPKSPQDSDFMLTPNSIQQTPDSLKPPKDSPRQDALTPSPQGSPLAARSRAASPDAPQKLSGLPRRLRSKTASIKSQASRFSFDMAGGGSAAQEKILEEKHRQRAAQRARATSLTSISINEEDDFDEDDLDYGDDMEDDIPGMNDDEYGFSSGGVANMTLGGPRNDYDEDIPGMDDEDENDFEVDGIGAGGLGNMTLDSFKSRDIPVGSPPTLSNDGPHGLGLQRTSLDTGVDAETKPVRPSASAAATVEQSRSDNQGEDDTTGSNDGFYFDDGEFGGEFADEDFDAASEGFDENLLDQDFVRGKMIGNMKPLPADNGAEVDSSRPSTRPESVDSEILAGKRRSEMTTDTSRTSMQLPKARRSSVLGQHDEFDATAGLTQENLSAYHNALAFAANKAAVQGRFERRSVTEGLGPSSSPDGAPRRRNVSFNEPRTSVHRTAVAQQSFTGDEDLDHGDDFNFDDTMDDEDIIAAANAEALENDDEGEYGSEFGFYASSYGSDDAQAYHGGYFGTASLNQIKRSHSGREAFQEPNLTPITERSEWSNRNSMISLAMHGSGISPGVLSPGSLPSTTPGLAQIADQMQNEGSPGDDMTLSALMKARRGAFGGGGSSTSLQSMGNPGAGSRSGSPSLYAFQQQQGISPLSANGPGMPPPPVLGEIEEYDKSRHSLPNPMLTLQTQNLSLRPTTSSSDSSPMKRNTPISGRLHGHSRTSSGADSVSYAVHKNDEGDEMWVVERRRTLENGDVEVLNRDVVPGTL